MQKMQISDLVKAAERGISILPPLILQEDAIGFPTKHISISTKNRSQTKLFLT
jgi:hypothetical protein